MKKYCLERIRNIPLFFILLLLTSQTGLSSLDVKAQDCLSSDASFRDIVQPSVCRLEAGNFSWGFPEEKVEERTGDRLEKLPSSETSENASPSGLSLYTPRISLSPRMAQEGAEEGLKSYVNQSLTSFFNFLKNHELHGWSVARFKGSPLYKRLYESRFENPLRMLSLEVSPEKQKAMLVSSSDVADFYFEVASVLHLIETLYDLNATQQSIKEAFRPCQPSIFQPVDTFAQCLDALDQAQRMIQDPGYGTFNLGLLLSSKGGWQQGASFFSSAAANYWPLVNQVTLFNKLSHPLRTLEEFKGATEGMFSSPDSFLQKFPNFFTQTFGFGGGLIADITLFSNLQKMRANNQRISFTNAYSASNIAGRLHDIYNAFMFTTLAVSLSYQWYGSLFYQKFVEQMTSFLTPLSDADGDFRSLPNISNKDEL